MRKLGFLFLLIAMLAATSFAQHCPFDGTYMIVARLTDRNDKPVENARLSLREVDNPQAASCAHSKGLLDRSLEPTAELINGYFRERPWGDTVKEFCEDCGFLGAGFYAAILTQSERFCMLYDDKNDLNSLRRKFEISYGEQTIAVQDSQVYRLCWAEGKWSRIEPVEIRVRNAENSGRSQDICVMGPRKAIASPSGSIWWRTE